MGPLLLSLKSLLIAVAFRFQASACQLLRWGYWGMQALLASPAHHYCSPSKVSKELCLGGGQMAEDLDGCVVGPREPD